MEPVKEKKTGKGETAKVEEPAVSPAEGMPKIKKKTTRVSPLGIAHIKSTFNNTIISVTDIHGSTVAWASSGVAGFKGTKKGTPFAAQSAAEIVARQALDRGVKEIDVFVKGPGPGRETAIRTLQAVGLTINTIKDVTPIPHDGCRPRKRRRV
jgi:small subunit ribosomal protein S11